MLVTLSSLMPQTICTDRLMLELYDSSPDHIDCFLACYNNTVFRREVGDLGCYTRQDVEQRINSTKPVPTSFEKAIEVDRSILYMFRVKEAPKAADTTTQFAGLVSVQQRLHSLPSIGCYTVPDLLGQGYATEAAMTIVNLARDELGLKRLTARIAGMNVACERVARNIGLVPTENEELDQTKTKMLRIFELPGGNRLHSS